MKSRRCVAKKLTNFIKKKMKKEREQKCIYDQIRNVYRMKLRGYIKNRNGKGFVVEQKKNVN